MLGVLEAQLFEQAVKKKMMPTMMPVSAPYQRLELRPAHRSVQRPAGDARRHRFHRRLRHAGRRRRRRRGHVRRLSPPVRQHDRHRPRQRSGDALRATSKIVVQRGRPGAARPARSAKSAPPAARPARTCISRCASGARRRTPPSSCVANLAGRRAPRADSRGAKSACKIIGFPPVAPPGPPYCIGSNLRSPRSRQHSHRSSAAATSGCSSSTRSVVARSTRSSPRSPRSPTPRCAARPTSCKKRVRRRRDARRAAARGVRRGARGRQAHAAHAPLRRAAARRHGAAQRQDRGDAHRRGQDAGRDAARLPERAGRQGRAHRHGQRLPRQARRRVDGPDLPASSA